MWHSKLWQNFKTIKKLIGCEIFSIKNLWDALVTLNPKPLNPKPKPEKQDGPSLGTVQSQKLGAFCQTNGSICLYKVIEVLILKCFIMCEAVI